MRRIGIVVAAVALALTSACGEQPGETEPQTPSPAESSPTEPEARLSADDVAGSWESEDGTFVYRLSAEGEYILDVDGVEQISSGQFTLEGTTITFVDGEADGQTGEFAGEVLTIAGTRYTKR